MPSGCRGILLGCCRMPSGRWEAVELQWDAVRIPLGCSWIAIKASRHQGIKASIKKNMEMSTVAVGIPRRTVDLCIKASRHHPINYPSMWPTSYCSSYDLPSLKNELIKGNMTSSTYFSFIIKHKTFRLPHLRSHQSE